MPPPEKTAITQLVAGVPVSDPDASTSGAATDTVLVHDINPDPSAGSAPSAPVDVPQAEIYDAVEGWLAYSRFHSKQSFGRAAPFL
jgi:hypothetical protein